MIMYQLAQKLGFGKELVKNYKMQKVKGQDEPETESSCVRSTARLDHRLHGPEPRAAEGPHAQHACLRRQVLRAKGGIDKETGYKLDGEYFGLPWPCWGTPEMKHPGSHEPVRHLAARDGGRRQLPRQLRRRARW
jgi:formate dehydrogenase major subunit